MECRAMFRQLLRQAPVGTDAGKNLPVLHLSGHDSASNAFAAKSLDELGKFSQRKPVHGCAAGFDLRGSFLFDRDDHNFVALRAASSTRNGKLRCRDDAEFGV